MQPGQIHFAKSKNGTVAGAVNVLTARKTGDIFHAAAAGFFRKGFRFHGHRFQRVNILAKGQLSGIKVSAKNGNGVEEIKKALESKITLFSGHSGVGKSTLINSILPGIETRTGEISSYHNKGMHTTTFSEMFPVEGNGYIIDTPGIKGFGTFDMEEEEIGHYFPEIFKISADCKYGNCTHRHEPGCAVRKAVEEHLISESRYTSYLNMLEDKEEGKYRAAY